MARLAGAKWLNEASYLTDADRAKVMAAVERCKAFCADHYEGARVGIRPPAYIGEPHPIATVEYTYRGGSSIFETVYKAKDD